SYDVRRQSVGQFQDKGYRTTTQNDGVNNGTIRRDAFGRESMNAGLNAVVRHEFSRDLVTRVRVTGAYEQRKADTASASGNFLTVKGVTSLNNTQSAGRTTVSALENIRTIGVSGGVAVDYKDRYSAEALVRRDGSSLFGAGKRWATFGRVSGAWRVAGAPWWFVPARGELKLRATCGTAVRTPTLAAQYETVTYAAGNTLHPVSRD